MVDRPFSLNTEQSNRSPISLCPSVVFLLHRSGLAVQRGIRSSLSSDRLPYSGNDVVLRTNCVFRVLPISDLRAPRHASAGHPPTHLGHRRGEKQKVESRK